MRCAIMYITCMSNVLVCITPKCMLSMVNMSSSTINDLHLCFFFFFKQKTAYEMRISDWSSDVCSSDLLDRREGAVVEIGLHPRQRGDEARIARSPGSKIGRASCRERVCQYV